MNEQLTYYIDLVSRYFAGEATPDQIQSLSVWINESDENLTLFNDYRKAWDLTEQSILDQKIDLDTEWSSIKTNIQTNESPAKPNVISLASSKTDNYIRGSSWWKVAATLIILVASAAIGYYYFSGLQNIILTADSGILEKTLPDGSVITLNKGAILEYPSRFGNKRQVKLSGEAYFKVMRDPLKPFIVSGNNARVEVLGTMFNINTATLSGNMSVVLTSGKVSVYYEDKAAEKVILLPGEQAEIPAKEHQILKWENQDANYMAWKTRRLVFDNIPLDKIIGTLNSVYHADVRLSDPKLANCRITATFDHQPVTSVLNVIKKTLDLQVQEKGSIFIVSGKPCK